jgi:hypothetical protein
MPWVIRDVIHDVNKVVGKRWQALDPLLPGPAAPSGWSTSSPRKSARWIASMTRPGTTAYL